jgi:antirestriction protein ArdC
MTNFENRLDELQREVTEKIVADLRKFESSGKTPSWIKPWKETGKNGMPQNLSGRFYSGINVLVLMLVQELNGYSSSKWGTFKAIKGEGGIVLKGETSTPGFFYKSLQVLKKDQSGRITLDEEGKPEMIEVFMLRYYSLFNLRQTTLKPEEPVEKLPVQPQFTAVQKLVKNSNAKLESGFNKAFYIPRLDLIRMPGLDQFKTEEDYWATLLHELVHWTGHETRLDRLKKFSYPTEELIAELGASFLCAEFNINGNPQHSEYIHHWIKEMESDYKHVFKIAAQASQAHRMLIELNPELKTNEVAA